MITVNEYVNYVINHVNLAIILQITVQVAKWEHIVN